MVSSEGFIPDLPPEKGKSVASLRASRSIHNAIRAYFGGGDNTRIPSSIMRADKMQPSLEEDEHGHIRNYSASGQLRKSGKSMGKLDSTFGISGRGAASGALSTFPQNIGRAVVLLYSKEGDTIYDPFAGHNSRMSLCVKAGRHYFGNDLSHDFMAFNLKKAKALRKKYPSIYITLVEGDARKVLYADNIADCTLSSPPYWDIEYYGPEESQLGNCKTYEGFMEGMKEVLRENIRVLRPGAFCVYFINDFRKGGKFYSYHSDLISAGVGVGFTLWDTMIVDFRRAFRDVFLQQLVDQRILPKRHEYGIVFRKP